MIKKYFDFSFINRTSIIYGVIFLCILVIYQISSPGETNYNYFSRLAVSFSHGQLYLTDHPAWLNELVPVNGKYYVVYPPMPAILMLPFVFLFGPNLSETLFSIGLGFITLILVNYLFLKMKVSHKTAILTTILLGLGTSYWFLVSIGSAWFLAHTVALFFLTLALIEAFGKKRFLFIGLAIGAAYWARSPVIFSLLFFYIYFWKSFWPINRQSFLNLVYLHIGVVFFVFLDSYYNFVRFNDISPLASYLLIPNINQDPVFNKGFMSLRFIPRHLDAILWQLPKLTLKPPFLIPSLYSTAVWFTTPAFLLLFRARLNDLVVSCLAAFSLIMFIVFCWAGVGYSQFGYRFLQDGILFLLIIFANIYSKSPSKWAYFLVLLSVLVNAWGVILINHFNLYTI